MANYLSGKGGTPQGYRNGQRVSPSGNRPAARIPSTATTPGGHKVKLTFDGVDKPDRQIVYVGTLSKQRVRDIAYWTKRLGVIAFPVQSIGTEGDAVAITAFEVKGPLQSVYAFCQLPFVQEYHDCIGVNLPRLASPNPVHGPRLPVSEKEELRRATAVQLSKPDAELAKRKADVASEPLSAAVLASFVPGTDYKPVKVSNAYVEKCPVQPGQPRETPTIHTPVKKTDSFLWTMADMLAPNLHDAIGVTMVSLRS